MRLWLIRHAKSDWKSPAAGDFERPLNDRGRADGPRMAAWLASEPPPATWIWTSDAQRASATAAFVADGFAAAAPQVVADHRLYDASPAGILDVVRATPPDETDVAVVAHNPGMTALVNLLCGEEVTANLPTFGVARLAVAPPWSGLAFGAATLEVFMSPKRLEGRR